MLTNVSYRDPKQEQVIADLVGKPFNLRMRLKLAGVGSPICFYSTTITMYVISKFDPKELLFDFGVYLKLSLLLFLFINSRFLRENQRLMQSIQRDRKSRFKQIKTPIHFFRRLQPKRPSICKILHKYLCHHTPGTTSSKKFDCRQRRMNNFELI